MRYSIVHEIPGGLYGNDPGSIPADPKRGSVAVDPKFAHQAIVWLAKRVKTIETTLSDPDRDSLLLHYVTR